LNVRIQPLSVDRRSEWEALYAAYAAFYRVEQSSEMRDRVWSWIMEEPRQVFGLIAVDRMERAIGLAHFREFARPLSATKGGFLDDLFVAPQARGTGAVEALLSAVAAEGRERGWSVIRWITSETNYRARAAYDRVATRTQWLTYDMQPGP
jgi:ribosomal protein S18 acetylase RimI-like enzyme